MKVIAIDNYDREHVANMLIKENVTKKEGEKLCKEHNEGPDSDYWYIVVDDDHRLWRGMADLVGDLDDEDRNNDQR